MPLTYGSCPHFRFLGITKSEDPTTSQTEVVNGELPTIFTSSKEPYLVHENIIH